jgi:hypothetical protein
LCSCASAVALTDGQSSLSEVDRKLMMLGFSPAWRLPKGLGDEYGPRERRTNPAVSQPSAIKVSRNRQCNRVGATRRISTQGISAKERA